jgi:hypothetical protein
MRFPPLIPGYHSLLKPCEMCLIRHPLHLLRQPPRQDLLHQHPRDMT